MTSECIRKKLFALAGQQASRTYYVRRSRSHRHYSPNYVTALHSPPSIGIASERLPLAIQHNATHVSFSGTARPHRRTVLRFHHRWRSSWRRTPRACQLEEHERQILFALCLDICGPITLVLAILFFICAESKGAAEDQHCCCIDHWSYGHANCHECRADFASGIGRAG